MFEEQIEKINEQITEKEELLEKQLEILRATKARISSLRKTIVQLEKLEEEI